MNSVKIKDYFKDFLNQSYGTTFDTKLQPESYVFFPTPNSVLDAATSRKFGRVPMIGNLLYAARLNRDFTKQMEEAEVTQQIIGDLNERLVDWNNEPDTDEED